MGMKFTNNATTTIAAGLTATSSTVTVATGTGALFPALGAGDYFYATLFITGGAIAPEIVKATSVTGDTFTITRAQQGTTAGVWPVNAGMELRLTAASLSDIPKLDENNVFTGNTTFPAGTITNPSLAFNNSGTGFYSPAVDVVAMPANNRVLLGGSTDDGSSPLQIIGTLRLTNIQQTTSSDLYLDNNGYMHLPADVAFSGNIGSGNGYTQLAQTGTILGSLATQAFTSIPNAAPGYIDTGISRIGVAAIGIGNGTNQNTGGSLTLADINMSGTIKPGIFTVATLPAAGTVGRISVVSDATAPSYLGALVGGGTVKTPVFDNGTEWVSF